MNFTKRFIAILDLLLVFPAGLFMTALFVRGIQPAPYDPAQTARRLVDWFAARPHLGLGVLLILMPLAALVIGGFTVVRSWRNDSQLRQAAYAVVGALRPHIAALVISAATLAAGGILAVVALHLITD